MRKSPYKNFILFLLPCVLCFGCSSLQKAFDLRRPTASLQGLKFGNISLSSANLLFDVEVENPYPVALPLVNLDYNLTTHTNQLLSGNAQLQSTIPAQSKKIITLPAKINYLDLINAFKNFKPGSTIPYEATMNLLVDTPASKNVRLPVRKKGELAVPNIPKATDLDWKKIIMDKIN